MYHFVVVPTEFYKDHQAPLLLAYINTLSFAVKQIQVNFTLKIETTQKPNKSHFLLATIVNPSNTHFEASH